MPALNFEPWKAPLVESGACCQTIRLERKHPILPGQTLYLFVGQRTTNCRRLGEATCKSVQPIKIGDAWSKITETESVLIEGQPLTFLQLVELVFADGFKGEAFLYDFFAFFRKKYGLPFVGKLIKW